MADETYISGEEARARKEISSNGSGLQGRKVTFTTRSIGLVVVVLILCGLSFYGGISYQKHHVKASAVSSTASRTGLGGGFGGTRRSGGFGQVTAVSSTSITLTNQRTNASTTYSITSTTTITDNGQAVTTSDIQTGDTVLVTTSASSSTTATSILVNPSFGGGNQGTGAPTDGSGN